MLGTSRVVMVGDTLETDIAGARAAGLDAVWIETGVTRDDPGGHAGHLRPTWRMAGLVAVAAGERPVSRGRARELPIGPGGADARGAPARPHADRRPRRRAVPIDVAAHGPTLYALSHGPEREAQWMYLWDGPYPSEAAFLENLAQKAVSEDPFFYSIVERASGRAVGVASYLRITPKDRVIEVGSILFTPALQRTRGATEAMYLMARHAFDTLGYRRYEWKCNALNAPSRRAAVRLGFTVRGHLPPAHDRQGPIARHRLVRDDRSRLAGDPRGLRGVARSRQLRRRRAAAHAAADAVNRRSVAASSSRRRERPAAAARDRRRPRVGFGLDARPLAAFPREAPGAGAPHPADERRTEARQAGAAGVADARIDDAERAGLEQARRQRLRRDVAGRRQARARSRRPRAGRGTSPAKSA